MSIRESKNNWPGLGLLCFLRRSTGVVAETKRFSTHSEWQRQFEKEEGFGFPVCLFFEVRRFDDV